MGAKLCEGQNKCKAFLTKRDEIIEKIKLYYRLVIGLK